MRLASVTFDTLVRKPDTHDVGTQASASKHFIASQFDIEWKDGKIFITHPSGDYPQNIVPECHVTSSSPLVETKVDKAAAARAALAEKRAAGR